MQLSFFPTCYPDELLYSIAARYHEVMRYSQYSDTAKDWYGAPSKTTSIMLPTHIQVLTNRLPWREWTPEVLINRHTLVPYYTFLVSEAFQERLYQSMQDGRPPHASAVIGAMAGGIKDPIYLRYCRDCVEEDRQHQGEAYWHRVHQAAGIIVCPIHKAPLTSSSVLQKRRRTRAEVISLEQAINPEDPLLPVNPGDLEKHQLLAIDTARMLEVGNRIQHVEAFRAVLQSRFRLVDWLTTSGRLRVKPVLQAWEAIYPAAYREAIDCGLENVKNPVRMLRCLLFGGRSSLHPIFISLFTRLAGTNLEAIAAELESWSSSVEDRVQTLKKKNHKTARKTTSSPHCVDSNERKARRRAWRQLRKSKPSYSRKELRRQAPGLWTWLYRHDRQWLDSHQPEKQSPQQGKRPINWNERDRQYCLDLIVKIREEKQCQHRPRKITRQHMAVMLGNTELFSARVIAKLPRLKRLSHRLAESRKQYAYRRILWCRDRYQEEGGYPNRWQFVRRAGLREDMQAECQIRIDLALAEIAQGGRGSS